MVFVSWCLCINIYVWQAMSIYLTFSTIKNEAK